jgi:hypothetical protein
VITRLLTCLRAVLDEGEFDRDTLICNTIGAFALSMPSQWFLCFEIREGEEGEDGATGGGGGAAVSILVPPHLRRLAAQQQQQQGHPDATLPLLPAKQSLDPSTVLRGGLRDFFLWLARAPALLPSEGEPGCHFLSAARVEDKLDVVGDGLLQLLDWDYYAEHRDADSASCDARSRRAGTSHAHSQRHKLLHHLAGGATPVYGARIDCYAHTDTDTDSTASTAGDRDRGNKSERYTHSLVILTGAVHSPLALPAMVARTREMTNFLDLLATVSDVQTILGQYVLYYVLPLFFSSLDCGVSLSLSGTIAACLLALPDTT